ncbi:MAG TPA: hypothetical protein VLT37_01640 [Acidocella sp.]|nr:hypothetical protein [Acidocella sp.]
MIRRRSRPADIQAALTEALDGALRGQPLPSGVTTAAALIAEAVAAHAASFPRGGEPDYHNHYHQAEATLAMGWLCAEALHLGLLDAGCAVAGILAMAGHDLQHDGSVPAPGVLEARSAALTVALAARAGLDQAVQDHIRLVILATDPSRAAAALDEDSLLCRLAREADLFASLTPELGWRLSQALGREIRAAGAKTAPPPDSFAGRLRLLRALPPMTSAARNLGLEAGVAVQLAALATLGDGDPESGAKRLDAMPPAEAWAHYRKALAAA